MKEPNFINFQDPDGVLRSKANLVLAEKKKAHPQVKFTLSAVIREAIEEGLDVIRARTNPKLEDKQRTGKLRK